MQQLQDGQMLARLRHDAVVCGNDQKCSVDAGGARDHVADELFMPGHVYHAHGGAVRQVKARKTQLDRDAAALFFCQPVGVGAGQRPNQRGFSVVDMPCCAKDDRRLGVARFAHASASLSK